MIKLNYKICSIGLFFLFIGILFSPSFVANHLSPDGVLKENTVKLVEIFRFTVIALGVLINILGILFEKWKTIILRFIYSIDYIFLNYKHPDNLSKFYFSRILFSSVLILLIFLYWRFYITSDIRFSGDSKCYIQQSKILISNLSFFNDCKPFTTPLFFKIAGSKPNNIIFYQQLFSVICWTFLGFSFSCFIKNRVLVLLSIIVFSMASLWWNVGGWNNVILSESVFFSLFALWLGLFFLLFHFMDRIWLVLLSIVSLFFAFTKPYIPFFLMSIVLIFIIPLYLIKIKQEQLLKLRKFLLLYLFIVSFIFALNFAPQFNNERQEQFSLINVVFKRILFDEEKVNWFEEKGMPIDDNLRTWKGEWASSRKRELYKNQTYSSFRNWTFHEGKSIYAFYLASHPYYSIKSVLVNMHQVFSYNLYNYTKKPPKNTIFNFVSIIWNPGYWTLIMVVLISIFYLSNFLRTENFVLLFQCVVFIGLLITAVLVFHADAMEVERHSLLLAVGVYTLFLCGVFIILDNLKVTIEKKVK